MTIDETITKEKANAEKLRKIIETGYDGEISIEALFCDDTDAIKEAYERFENCVKEHKQIAEWLEELKVLRHEANEWRKAGYSHGYNKALNDLDAILVDELEKSKNPYESWTIKHILEVIHELWKE